MRIINARWRPRYNEVLIQCTGCNARWWARADRHRLNCPGCKQIGDINDARMTPWPSRLTT